MCHLLLQENPNQCLGRWLNPALFSAGGGRCRPLQAALATRVSLSLPLQLEYAGASPVQLRFLRLHSHLATQKVSYSCRPAPEQGQPQLEKEIRFLADSREQSYAASLQGCVVSLAGAPGRAPQCLQSPSARVCIPRVWDRPGGLRLHVVGWGWRASSPRARGAALVLGNGLGCGRAAWDTGGHSRGNFPGG